MDEMELLITTLSLHQCNFNRISYKDLFNQSLDLDIDRLTLESLRGHCLQMVPGTQVSELEFDQCLDLLLTLVIAPSMHGYQFVCDYPRSQAALARINADNSNVAERFELFFDGIELANGFSELTDCAQQRSRFEQDMETRSERGLPQYTIDEHLLAALESGMEDCAGVALGLDRLLMVLLDLDSIDQVLSFRD
jgi:lysyl-tRNA synthetase class 2